MLTRELARLRADPSALDKLSLEEFDQLEQQMQQALACVQAAKRTALERRRAQEDERRRRTRERECVICMEADVAWVVFVPCGHIVCCASCAEHQQACPTCRADIVQRVRTYID